MLDVLDMSTEVGRRHDRRCGSHNHLGRYRRSESTTAKTFFRQWRLIMGISDQRQSWICFGVEDNLECEAESSLQEPRNPTSKLFLSEVQRRLTARRIQPAISRGAVLLEACRV
jgi:hypothetical protein